MSISSKTEQTLPQLTKSPIRQDQAKPQKKIIHDYDDVIDYDVIKFNAAKVYQYTVMEKKKLCLEDEDFLKYLKSKYGSLR